MLCSLLENVIFKAKRKLYSVTQEYEVRNPYFNLFAKNSSLLITNYCLAYIGNFHLL